MPNFTADWFTQYADEWIAKLGHRNKVETHVLEVGSYEGRSTHWFLMNLLRHSKSTITCIDTWDGKDKTLGEQTLTAYSTFIKNIRPFGTKVKVIQSESWVYLSKLRQNEREYDLVFIDGDHEGYNALLDLLLSWPMVKVGGCLVFDDYIWSSDKLRSQPKDGWDAFIQVKPLGLKWELVGRMMFATKIEEN